MKKLPYESLDPMKRLQKNHWGIYCSLFETCTREGLCEQACPEGGTAIDIPTNSYEQKSWNKLWEAPDGSYKGRCDKCGFVHFFIEGHDTQYKFCPNCGEKKE